MIFASPNPSYQSTVNSFGFEEEGSILEEMQNDLKSISLLQAGGSHKRNYSQQTCTYRVFHKRNHSLNEPQSILKQTEIQHSIEHLIDNLVEQKAHIYTFIGQKYDPVIAEFRVEGGHQEVI